MSAEIDPLIHQTTRLRLMAILNHLEPADWIDFNMLKNELSLTDGNLGAQLIKLEEAKYLRIKKGFLGRRPRTQVQATQRGRTAFTSHCETLRKIIDNNHVNE